MSGPVAVFAAKAITSAVLGKVVGKVTGNEKLGMAAALVAGVANPLNIGGTAAAGASGVGASGGMGAGMAEAGIAATTPEVASTAGGILSKAASVGTGVTDAIAANPTTSLIGAQMVGGAASNYEKRKMAEKQIAAEERMNERAIEGSLELERLRQEGTQAEYEREHQGFNPNIGLEQRTGGLLSTPPETMARSEFAPRTPTPSADIPSIDVPSANIPSANIPESPAEQYYNRYHRMYGNRRTA